MANEVSIFTQQTEVSRVERKTALGELLKDGIGSSHRRIQANTNGTFKKIVGGEQVGDSIRGEFNAIVVGMLKQVSRIYYKEKFDPKKEATLPNCWSNEGIAPEKNAPDPQASSCATCQNNIAGSGETGGKACRFQRRISIMLEGDTSGNIYQFNIPAKSLFGKGSGNVHPFESYVKFLGSNGLTPDLVVTTISFDNDADTMELKFSPLREINDDEYELVLAAQKRPETSMYTKITVAQTDGVTKQPISNEVLEEDEAEEEEEIAEETPKKRAKKKQAEPTVDKEMASVISEWAAED